MTPELRMLDEGLRMLNEPRENWLCRCGRANVSEFQHCPDCGCSRVVAQYVVDVMFDRLAEDLVNGK